VAAVELDAPRTRVIETLEARGIPYKLLPHQSPVFTVEEAARQRDVLIEEMVKSILLRDKKRQYIMACVRGDERVDPKAVREHVGDERFLRLQFATAEEIEQVTGGCVMGAVAPIGLPPEVPVLFDEALKPCTRYNTSSGDPVAGLELAAADLIKISGARFAPIAKRD
jgi:prolyl-tRNA editing enzyme YbaK/EbsC (Cys-tRNA(Pro) deacylase)